MTNLTFNTLVEEIIQKTHEEVQRSKDMGHESSFYNVCWEVVGYYFETMKIDAYDSIAEVYEFVEGDYTGNVYYDCRCGWHNYITWKVNGCEQRF